MSSAGNSLPYELRWLLLVGVLACCAHHPGDYDRALDSARSYERAGRLEDASSEYRRAVTITDSEEEKVEALYREAQVWRRKGARTIALKRLLELVQRYPEAPRSSRALLDAARILERDNRQNEARTLFLQVIEDYPDSTAAESAVTAYARLAEPPLSRMYEQLRKRIQPGRLDELVRLRWGEALAKEGKPARAIDTLEEMARDYPLPTSSRADEALLLAATLRRQLGDVQGCLSVLNFLISQQTRADILGSYVRDAYVQARWLKGELLRDELREVAAAEAAFLDLATTFPQSLKADDALWQASLLAHQAGAASRACDHARRLDRREPASRYRTCLRFVCAEFKGAPESRKCQEAAQRPREPLRPSSNQVAQPVTDDPMTR